jgi:hypothetical protein
MLEKGIKVNYTFITIILRIQNWVSAYDSIFDRVSNTFDTISSSNNQRKKCIKGKVKNSRLNLKRILYFL